MQIKDIMSQPAVTCPVTGTLDHAARLMWEHDCGVIPVVNHEGRLAGIVTDRDICMAAYTQGQPLCAIPITTAMAVIVVAVHADDSVERAEELMRDNKIRRLPVLDADWKPVGLVSMNDLARLAGRVKKSGVDRQLISTLAEVCRPRGHVDLPVPQMERARPALVG